MTSLAFCINEEQNSLSLPFSYLNNSSVLPVHSTSICESTITARNVKLTYYCHPTSSQLAHNLLAKPCTGSSLWSATAHTMSLSSGVQTMGVFIFLIASACFAACAHGHAFLDWPNPRGALSFKQASTQIDRSAPTDFRVFFPAGLRSGGAGAGRRSQMRAARRNWNPYEPLKPGLRWRAGVCGDTINGRQHLRRGKFYYPRNDAKAVATFRSGDVIDARMQIVAHHNGFVELHLCDVSKCPSSDISRECFRRGHCIQLKRARNPVCDNGQSKKCGPIDRKYRGRWYLPCNVNPAPGVWDKYGPGTMKFKIPSTFSCTKCVLQWFYTSANYCNPPGVVEYFDGPDRPRNWGKCSGQAGAQGGVARKQPACGGTNFPEEYYNCADIIVNKR